MQFTSNEIHAEPISGRNPMMRNTDELQALAQFYRAFNTRDLALMEQNWLPSDESTMTNPLGGIARGWANIRIVYERIFNSGSPVHVEFHDYTLHIIGSMFYAVGRERGFVVANDQRLDLEIRTSRLFRLEVGRWRQVHHHGSIENCEMLKAYQQAIQWNDRRRLS